MKRKQRVRQKSVEKAWAYLEKEKEFERRMDATRINMARKEKKKVWTDKDLRKLKGNKDRPISELTRILKNKFTMEEITRKKQELFAPVVEQKPEIPLVVKEEESKVRSHGRVSSLTDEMFLKLVERPLYPASATFTNFPEFESISEKVLLNMRYAIRNHMLGKKSVLPPARMNMVDEFLKKKGLILYNSSYTMERVALRFFIDLKKVHPEIKIVDEATGSKVDLSKSKSKKSVSGSSVVPDDLFLEFIRRPLHSTAWFYSTFPEIEKINQGTTTNLRHAIRKYMTYKGDRLSVRQKELIDGFLKANNPILFSDVHQEKKIRDSAEFFELLKKAHPDVIIINEDTDQIEQQAPVEIKVEKDRGPSEEVSLVYTGSGYEEVKEDLIEDVKQETVATDNCENQPYEYWALFLGKTVKVVHKSEEYINGALVAYSELDIPVKKVKLLSHDLL